MQEGTVIKSTGSWYQVLLDTETTINCRITGKFRLDGMKLTNPVAVGDRVKIILEDTEEQTGMIKKIMPRNNYVVRQSPRKKHHLHLLASNIDQAVVIVTMVEPLLKQGFIDRFLLMTEPHDIPCTIVFNKKDLYSGDDVEYYEALSYIYKDIGYNTMLVSSYDKESLIPLKELLKDKTTLISGQSGVGKSTLVNGIQPQLELRTGDLSDYTGKGMHTTTFAEMFPLDFGGYIIDTPGIKTLSFNNLEPMDVAHNFKEFFALSEHCKYADCTHRNEPKCAVKEAIEEGRMSDLRYHNYLLILNEIEDQNYWERHTNM